MSDYSGEYIIKVRYKSQYRNVYVKQNDLTLDSLINDGLYFIDHVLVIYSIQLFNEFKINIFVSQPF